MRKCQKDTYNTGKCQDLKNDDHHKCKVAMLCSKIETRDDTKVFFEFEDDHVACFVVAQLVTFSTYYLRVLLCS